ncbi:MAG: hypothetical protein LBO78_04135 [Rickettsiales bacterium]|jgi:hypothetical protein|nr:hypothetical protein [Rickettsiales bacterium]
MTRDYIKDKATMQGSITDGYSCEEGDELFMDYDEELKGFSYTDAGRIPRKDWDRIRRNWAMDVLARPGFPNGAVIGLTTDANIGLEADNVYVHSQKPLHGHAVDLLALRLVEYVKTQKKGMSK